MAVRPLVHLDDTLEPVTFTRSNFVFAQVFVLALALASALVSCNAILGVQDVTLAESDKDAGKRPSTDSNGDGKDVPPVVTQKDSGSGSNPSEACKGAKNCVRFLFVTSATFTGRLDGLVGADQKCAAAAAAIPALSARSFRAWLSDTSISATTRLTHGTSAYRRTDKGVVATNFADLSDGTLALPIALDENGLVVDGTVWTGTDSTGNAGSFNCADWSDDSLSESGGFGDILTATAAWSSSSASSCDVQRHLYCVED